MKASPAKATHPRQRLHKLRAGGREHIFVFRKTRSLYSTPSALSALDHKREKAGVALVGSWKIGAALQNVITPRFQKKPFSAGCGSCFLHQATALLKLHIFTPQRSRAFNVTRSPVRQWIRYESRQHTLVGNGCATAVVTAPHFDKWSLLPRNRLLDLRRNGCTASRSGGYVSVESLPPDDDVASACLLASQTHLSRSIFRWRTCLGLAPVVLLQWSAATARSGARQCP